MTGGQQLRLTACLAIPSIIAQFTSVLLQYIDAAMVGNLGANPAASIGLVSTSTWILNGFAMAVCSGFSVQVAHRCGAKDFRGAREIMRQGFTAAFCFGILLSLIGTALSGPLPAWLGGDPVICDDASAYFRIYSLFLPFMALGFASNAMLQASGNTKVPSILFMFMAVMDVVFNYLFIYLLGWGVPGAAMGTGLAEMSMAAVSLCYTCTRSPELRIKGEGGSFAPQGETVRNAFGITGPLWLQNIIMRGAYVVATIIVAPLGPVAIAANSFAITAESFCYMPGYGLQESATTLVGQSLGAGRKQLARQFAHINISVAAVLMTMLGALMYAFAPELMGILTSDSRVIELGAKVLRIEAFAETFYAVAMVSYGSCVGAGDTLVPTALNFASMWVVRIGLALLLTPKFGLVGYWIAMCAELNVRGILFLIRIRRGKWLNKRFVKAGGDAEPLEPGLEMN